MKSKKPLHTNKTCMQRHPESTILISLIYIILYSLGSSLAFQRGIMLFYSHTCTTGSICIFVSGKNAFNSRAFETTLYLCKSGPILFLYAFFISFIFLSQIYTSDFDFLKIFSGSISGLSLLTQPDVCYNVIPEDFYLLSIKIIFLMCVHSCKYLFIILKSFFLTASTMPTASLNAKTSSIKCCLLYNNHQCVS